MSEEKQLKVIYMVNGLIIIAESVGADEQARILIKKALGLVPGQQRGDMQFMEAFPFTDLDTPIAIENGSYIAVTDIEDQRLVNAYRDARTKLSAQKSGIVLAQ